jgi:hypothetical protein
MFKRRAGPGREDGHRGDRTIIPVTAVPADFAADGIDELIMAMFGRDAADLTAAQRAGPHQVLQVVAVSDGTAGDDSWLVELTADGRLAARVARGAGPADCTLTGPAPVLYQLLWNRCSPASGAITISGDAAILQSWRAGMRVRWS